MRVKTMCFPPNYASPPTFFFFFYLSIHLWVLHLFSWVQHTLYLNGPVIDKCHCQLLILLLATKFCPSVCFQASHMIELLQCVHRHQLPCYCLEREKNFHLLTWEEIRLQSVTGHNSSSVTTCGTWYHRLYFSTIGQVFQASYQENAWRGKIIQRWVILEDHQHLWEGSWLDLHGTCRPCLHIDTHRTPPIHSHSSLSFPWHSHFSCHKLGVLRRVL